MLKRRRPQQNYIHILRAMKDGDVLYLTELQPRLGETVRVAFKERGGKAKTEYLWAVRTEKESLTAIRVVQITALSAMKE